MSEENPTQSQILLNQTKNDEQLANVKKENTKSPISNHLERNSQKRVILYTAADGKVTVNVFFAEDNFWMTQKTMAELFGVKTPAISKHLKNIYVSKELIQEATVSKMETVQVEGQREIFREVEIYNLDAVIAVGYRFTHGAKY